MDPAASVPVPKRMRYAALLCVFLATFVGLFAAAEALSLGHIQERRQALKEEPPQLSMFGDPKMIAAMSDAQLGSQGGMKGSRSFVLGALATTCIVAWVSASRLLRPGAVPREGVRRLLVGSLLAAAVLRTIDGAQWAVVARRGGAAAVPYLAQMDGQNGELLAVTLPATMVGLVIFHTAVLAGAFLLLSRYFGSDQVKQVVALQDSQQQG